MKVSTKEAARDLLGGETPETFIAQLSSRLELVGGAYAAPVKSAKQIALARLFAYWILRDSPVCLYVTGWSVAPTGELLDLFYGYRRSTGEKRFLIEAPVHVFETKEDDALISILSMVLLFCWDAWCLTFQENGFSERATMGGLKFELAIRRLPRKLPPNWRAMAFHNCMASELSTIPGCHLSAFRTSYPSGHMVNTKCR